MNNLTSRLDTNPIVRGPQKELAIKPTSPLELDYIEIEQRMLSRMQSGSVYE